MNIIQSAIPLSRRKLTTLSIIALSSALFSASSFAGAWVGEKGTGYVKLGFADYNADEMRPADNDLVEFNGQNTSLYFEHGLGNNFAVYGSLLNQSIDQTQWVDDDNNPATAKVLQTQSNSGFGDTELGLKYQWQANPFVVSTSFLVKLPSLYDKDDALPLGNGQEDYEAKVLIGRSLNEFGYFGIEAGYRLRTGAPSDEYRYLIEYGFNVNDNIYLRTKLDGILSAENADDGIISDLNDNAANPLEFDAGKLELTAGWNFSKQSTLSGYGIEFTWTQEIYGKGILEGNSYQLGITKVY
jgi:hypothetical protein